ncbi:cell wall-active antibiotics response protein LiaF [Rummeliibacillus sp. TYF-LIM-RU47]|uniref:cell wall-active antibiotics response protein LiaF n=1 Tax=Rummeliibacillus sp. TYF-LIM-RU47 TaxID=2608406 RepID=UPI00123BFD79|nr:cell wall-active antibiotics response protein LiaF [Rummeliibacillus sp. TYF-LIM-RU47]
MTHLSTKTLTMLGITAFLLIFIEATFFGNGSIMFAIIGAFFMYVSIRRKRKWLFWLGVIFLGIALLSMWSLRLVIIGVLLYLLWKLRKGEEFHISVSKQPAEQANSFIQNKLFSFQGTPIESYEWQDVHIQSLAGDLLIDVTQTVLPKGASLISVRQGFGKVKVLVPYEIPVRLHYSTFIGDAHCFGQNYPRIWNDTIAVRNGYENAEDSSAELIITVSTLFGNVEVIRQ